MKKDRFTKRVKNSYCKYILKDMSGIRDFDRRDIEGSLDADLSMAIDRLGEYEDKDKGVRRK